MLTKRIIACLDVRAGRVVKGIQFLDIVDAGDPAELAHRHAAAGADEIVLLDITATHERRGTLIDTVKRTAAQLFIPFTVGGGIRSAADAEAVFHAGADKVSINSAAIARPDLITDIGASFGAQAVIVAIDARRAPERTAIASSPRPERERRSGEPAFLKKLGTPKSTSRAVANPPGATSLIGPAKPNSAAPVKSSSPAWTPTAPAPALTANLPPSSPPPCRSPSSPAAAPATLPLRPVFSHASQGEHIGGKADAALAASIFHFGITDSWALKRELQTAGIPVRL